MSQKKPPRLPRNAIAHLPPKEQERILKILNDQVRVANTASIYTNVTSSSDLHRWTVEDFRNMQTGALNRKGGSKGGSASAEQRRSQADLRARQVLQDFKAGMLMKAIAEKYGFTRQGVHKILTRAGQIHPRKK